MSTTAIQLEAGGLLPARTKTDAGAVEQIVARTYRHPALSCRPVVRLASDRLGQAEDLAMEFLGFGAPDVSPPIALQQRRSLGFAAWALVNDPGNARFALDLVKRMKRAARQARSKPGHAWDAYMEMAKDLGRSARHFLPPFWEEVGRTFKDLGNQTYAGRALNKSLEAERVHALESDRARRRDVVLEFVLSGCLSGNALSDYGNDLANHYPAPEAFAIFRDLCVRRTQGGMSPWATLPKDFLKLAKAAGMDADQELEKWLQEVIETPAMGRAPHQFWKSCSSHCQRIVARNPAFAVELLRHTKPEQRYYGESKLGPWFELLEEWGVFEYLWEDQHHGAPALGEQVAHWFGRIVPDDIPAPKRTLEMLEKLAPRLKKENTPLPLSSANRYGQASAIDIDVLEACLTLGIKVDDPPPNFSVTFAGWLSANVDHPFRNQDIVASWKDERFQTAIFRALDEALGCRGGTRQRGYRQANLELRPFPLAAGDRPGIKELWDEHTSEIIDQLEKAALASFAVARTRLESTLWPDTLRLFPDLAQRLSAVDPVAMLQRTLQAGCFDEYGLPVLEQLVDQGNIKIQTTRYNERNIYLTFPCIAVSDKVHAYVIDGDGKVKTHELRLPLKAQLTGLIPVGDDLAVSYRDDTYRGHFYWVSDPAQVYDAGHGYNVNHSAATMLKNGSVFLGQQSVRPGDKQWPSMAAYFHDGQRFWRISGEYDQASRQQRWKCHEVDPHSGKQIRESVPPWFEDTEGGMVLLDLSQLLPAPPAASESPLGVKDGLLGWKVIRRPGGTTFGAGIDGRRWDKPGTLFPLGMLRQPGTDAYLPVTPSAAGHGASYSLWDPAGTTIIAELQDFGEDYACGQVAVLPLRYWHFLKLRDEASSAKLRGVSRDDCTVLLGAAGEDRAQEKGKLHGPSVHATETRLVNLLPAVKKLLPTAPQRMVLGIARLIERAGHQAAAFTDLRHKASTDSDKETKTSALTIHHKSDLAASHWGLRAFHLHGEHGEISVSAHLAESAQFIKGKSPAGTLPRTNFLWFSMIEDLPVRSWQTFWRATAAKMSRKEANEVPWLDFLQHWHETGLADLPGQFHVMEAVPESAKKNPYGGFDLQVVSGTSFSLQSGEDRFVVVAGESYYHHHELPYHVLRYSTAKSPGTPPGYQVRNVRKLTPKHDPAHVPAFLAAARSCTDLPLPSKEELAAVAQSLAASPTEVGLIWLGGLNVHAYQHNFLPAELRSALGWKTTEASAARQALQNLNSAVLAELYDAVVAEGMATPFAADRGPALKSLEKIWREKMPKRLPLEPALQKRLSALGRTSRWHRVAHEELLGVAADPANHPLLQARDFEIKLDKDRSYASLRLGTKNKEDTGPGDSLRSIMQLVAMVHAETPAGHPARAALPALIKQTTKVLNHPGTLLDLRSVYLYDHGKKQPIKPAEWLNKHLGKTKTDSKDGMTRYDDGLLVAAALDSQHQAIVAFRPAKLKSEADLARLYAVLSLGADEEYTLGGQFIPMVAALRSPGFQKLAKAVLAKETPEGQWPQNPRHTAPQVVKAIQKKLKLGEDAAVLYAQLVAVPDPTSANICTWNGWTGAQVKQAAAELVRRKLVLEATRARAGRSIFLPGEWADLKAPWLPIETWKLRHMVELDIKLREPSPAGGPMVLRPFEDLFAAAWQRVLDGDEPRYEEVKRRKERTTKNTKKEKK
jgi:hypothetical protein